jgi:hypothetical protein
MNGFARFMIASFPGACLARCLRGFQDKKSVTLSVPGNADRDVPGQGAGFRPFALHVPLCRSPAENPDPGDSSFAFRSSRFEVLSNRASVRPVGFFGGGGFPFNFGEIFCRRFFVACCWQSTGAYRTALPRIGLSDSSV